MTSVGRSLYHGYRGKKDLKRVIEGMPWTFSTHLIVFHKLESREDPLQVPLVFFNFLGSYSQSAYGIYREVIRFKRIRVKMDIWVLLKRNKGIVLDQNCLYERLTLSCFLCGKLGHDEGFCPTQVTLRTQVVGFSWDISLAVTYKRRLTTKENIVSGSSEEGQMELGSDMEDNLLGLIDDKKRYCTHVGNLNVSIKMDLLDLGISTEIFKVAAKKVGQEQ
ncbi:hypothetical protein CXB51_014692 [Gossypium anomalum]|uniref:CCHC-type domain-containing protein n=1 Tax=Gossypium anomalum TaxID=47600 RepID=A0A8J5YRT7_9ROSI|nr:hypothetical protein CXB51_014692 [Gossypium anomalum]